MAMNHNRENGVLDIQLEGRMDSANLSEFQREVELVISEGEQVAVLFNMRRLEYINSGGMRSILEIARGLQRQNTRFAVYSLAGPVKDVFRMSGFDRVIPTCSTQAEALARVSD